MARSDWQYVTGSTNNNTVFFTGIRWKYRDDLFGTSGYSADRISSNTDIIEYQPYVGKKSAYTSNYYANWLTSNYKYSYNTTSGSDPASASNQLNISTTFRFDKASTNTNYYLTKGSLSTGNVMNTNSSNVSRIIEVPHCSDGTSKLRLYFYFAGNSGTSFTYAETNQIVTLETIPRASSFTISKTSGGSAATSFTLGETIYVNITRASDSFTHRVYWKVGSSSNQSLSTSATTSANGTLALSMANYIPSANGTATMYVDTYSGSTLIGSASKTFTLNVPDSVKPTISSVTTSDTQGRLSTYGAYVQGKSTLRIQTSASGVYGSTIQSCSVQIKSGSTVLQTLSGIDVSLTNISYTGSLTISVTVKDSRGRTSNATTKTITVATYSNPKVSSLTAERRNNDATVTLNFNASITNINSKDVNSKTFTLQKRQNGGSWSTLQTYTSGYTYSNSSYTTTCDENYAWEFRLTAQDSFTSTTITAEVGTVFELINWGSNGTSLAFGKVASGSNLFECALNSNFTGSLKKNGDDVALVNQIPTVNNATLTIQKNGSTVKTFTANASSNVTANITVPTNNNELTNGRGFTTFDCTTGTSGIWTYAKFSNGLAMCFAREEKSITVSNSFGELKTSANQTIADFPFNFTSIPIVSRWIDGGNSGIAMNDATHKASVSNAGGYQVARGTTITNGNFIINTIAVGYWK